MKKNLMFVFLSILLSGCNLFSGISYENDRVMKTKRYRFETNFKTDQRLEQSYSQNIIIIKEKDKNGIELYTMFDEIKMPIESYDLSDKMYIIIDKETFILTNSQKETIIKRDIKENNTPRKTKADVSKTMVKPENDLEIYQSIRMTHPINEEIIKNILKGREVNLRYYAGPKTITSEIKSHNLRSIKKMIKK